MEYLKKTLLKEKAGKLGDELQGFWGVRVHPGKRVKFIWPGRLSLLWGIPNPSGKVKLYTWSSSTGEQGPLPQAMAAALLGF